MKINSCKQRSTHEYQYPLRYLLIVETCDYQSRQEHYHVHPHLQLQDPTLAYSILQ